MILYFLVKEGTRSYCLRKVIHLYLFLFSFDKYYLKVKIMVTIIDAITIKKWFFD